MDRLQVNGIMKNYLIAIDNELKNCYPLFIEDTKKEDMEFKIVVNNFVDNVTSLMDYYAESIYKSGKQVILKKLGQLNKPSLNENDEQFIKSYKYETLNKFSESLNEGIINCFQSRENDEVFYDQIIELIIGNCIKLFKISQLNECSNNEINEINLISDSHSCTQCQTMSKFKHNVKDLLKQADNLHSFCKLSIDLNDLENVKTQDLIIKNSEIEFLQIPSHLAEKAKSIGTHLNMMIPELITPKKFKFVLDISDESEFTDLLNKKYNEIKIAELKSQIKCQLMSYHMESKILVSNKFGNNLKYIVTSALLEEKLMQKNYTWWKEDYFEKLNSKYTGENVAVYAKPFINCIAEQDPESHFVQSAITYVLEPEKLKNLDEQNYKKLKHDIFNGIEFLRG